MIQLGWKLLLGRLSAQDVQTLRGRWFAPAHLGWKPMYTVWVVGPRVFEL